MRICLYQPEIPQNVGTILRLGACLNLSIDLIEPLGFVWHDKHLRRAGMDYLDLVNVVRHANWEAYISYLKHLTNTPRIILIDTKADENYQNFSFENSDILLFGKESCGVPDDLFFSTQYRLKIPMTPHSRSLNVAVAAAMVVSIALLKTNNFPI